MKRVFITTTDNPYDPDKEYEKWRRFDDDMGYHTSELLDRVATVPENLGDVEYWSAIESAVDEIIKYEKLYRSDLIYKKLVKDYPDED